MSASSFLARHVGPQPSDVTEMLRAIGVASLDQLIDETVPPAIRRAKPLKLAEGESEAAYLTRLRGIAGKNKVFRSYLGLGYYGCITPPVIQRCVLENPSWYTPYTPYQAEIAQGRLEALLNYQTMVADLTGMDVANASLLDEGTAAAEAMAMLHRIQEKQHRHAARNVFFVSDKVFPQTLDVLRSRAEPIGIELRVGQFRAAELDASVFGALLQYPDADGNVSDLRGFIQRAHDAGVLVAVATDLLALTLLTPPGELGADVALGNSQRFGVPMGYGGPHAAFFATRLAHMRELPGRIIGVSIDAAGNPAYRMALQTREQHIRREKAKSNICTAQALLANIAGFYAAYHGPDGLREIAMRIHGFARILESVLRSIGFVQENPYYFDTLKFSATTEVADRIRAAAIKKGINLRYDVGSVLFALDESVQLSDLKDIAEVMARCGL
jgi:glycine dehydrogenase